MDEVHYLADRMRGAVWEEVIIHLPESVAVASLSATVSNAEEFGEWLGTVRGETTTIVEERRPVPLYQHVVVGPADVRPVRRRGRHRPAAEEPGAAGQPRAAPRRPRRLGRAAGSRTGARHVAAKRPHEARHQPTAVDAEPRRRRRAARPRRAAAGDRVHLQPGRLRRRRAAVPERQPAADLAGRARRDLRVRRGAAARTCPTRTCRCSATTSSSTASPAASPPTTPACCPRFKECVEELFLRGLCRVVFATETLALGINMPARSVVIEKLSKWNGETHADITPGEYTQLTGRAGRRGIDVEGHGVVLWQPGLDPKAVAGLASTRTYPLKSSFRPSYNMAVNLVHQFGRERARELLESSFAQFQADKAVVGLARQLRKSEDALAGYAEAASLPPRRLHGVRRPAAPPLRHREGPRQVPALRPPPGGDRLAGVAAARRRDRGARRPLRRDGGRDRPRAPGPTARARGPTCSPPTSTPAG